MCGTADRRKGAERLWNPERVAGLDAQVCRQALGEEAPQGSGPD